ncbi:MAG TPA: rod shape-determining protein MreD [Fibrobacteraceae bacterium]|nr:rod shape-determining protein MreD [Fibrobacteraceae bacterium]
MIRILGYLLFYVVAFVAQTVLAPMIRVFDVSPDFVLFFVVFISLRYGALAGVFWGFVAGFTEDVYSDLHWLGAAALTKTVVGYAVGQFEEKFINLGLVTKVAVLGVAFFLNDAIYGMVTGMSRDLVTKMFLTRSLPEGLYTLVLGTLAFHFLYPRAPRHVS